MPLIIPPPDIRAIVEKTAMAVAKNGVQFEERIRENEIGNQKFSFLNPTDPYRSFYDHSVMQLQAGNTDSLMKHPIPEARPFKESIVQKEPEAPPRYEFLIENAPKLAAQDLDIIKLTAYHVAHNGRSFLIDLATREASNFQFDFLKPSHSLYIYFGKLVDQYTRIILKSKNVVNLVESCKDKFELLELIKVRAEYTRFKKNELSDQTKKIEEDKTAFSRIDWHSFMVLDTIEFTEVDETMDFPPPISIQDLVKMSLAEKKQSSKAIHNVVDVNAPGVDDAMDMDEDVVPVSKKIRV